MNCETIINFHEENKYSIVREQASSPLSKDCRNKPNLHFEPHAWKPTFSVTVCYLMYVPINTCLSSVNRNTNPFQVLFKQRKKAENSGYYIQYRLIERKKERESWWCGVLDCLSTGYR